jgi:DNA invertase Pin-like site-specific DNA recombinase
MNSEQHLKVTASHLGRLAYLYVRQSTLRQVLENTESTKRQYALRERAMALGWPVDRVVVIDSDLGMSGADSDREGFQRLVAAVGLGEVGVVLGLEVSRLARSSSDWHRLLEICALTDTLILDEDGIYNPAQFNDRLLLGLKGTMSEAELHVLRARLIGGQLAKASRGELEMRLPVGLVNDAAGHVVLDPDLSVQGAVRTFFDTFARTGSATATVRGFREQGLLFPRRLTTGAHKGEVAWGPLHHSRALRVLKNPRYTGTLFMGAPRAASSPAGRSCDASCPANSGTP